jgi:hypothetical protein
MIQRIQSVYLLLVVVISALLFFIPLFYFENGAAGADVAITRTSFSIATNAFLLILNCAIGAIAFVTIFLYRKRPVQIRSCNLTMVLICILIGLLFYTADALMNGMNQRAHYQFGSYLPLMQLVFTFLAARGIKKDEALVRSADRLR